MVGNDDEMVDGWKNDDEQWCGNDGKDDGM